MRLARDQGFTLVELMVVVAIVGVLSTVAVVSMNPGESSRSVKGYSSEVAGRLELANQRAVATGRYHRVQVQKDSVNLWQGKTTGMAVPTDWDLVSQLGVPRDVVVHAVDDRAHVEADDGVPGAGAGLDALIDFRPDGSAEASTIFIGSVDGKRRARVLLYSATSSIHLWDGW